MYYRNAVKIAYACTTTVGGIIGLNKGIDIVEKNRYRNFEELSTISRLGENVCALTIIGGSTMIGSMFGPLTILASQFMYPNPPKKIHNE